MQDFKTVNVDDVRFAFPSDWSEQIGQSGEGIRVDLQSRGNSFGGVGVYPAVQLPVDVISQALTTLREEHPALELEEIHDEEFDEDYAYEAVFFSVDVVSYCWMRCFSHHGKTIFVFIQSDDKESHESEAVFRGIGLSIKKLAQLD